MELSDISRIISPTLSRQLFMLAKQYDDVIDFTLGDPDIPTPVAICEAAGKAALEGKTRYSPNAGLPMLREIIAEHVTKESGIEYSSNNVAITVGATQAVYLSFMACINPGDEVIIFAPYWVQYENIVRLLGGKPVIVDKFREGFEPDIHAIRQVFSDKTKAIVVNSPNNPSGCVYGGSFLEELAELSRGYGIMVFSDEAYSSLVYDNEYTSITRYCNKEDIVLINSFSKKYAMTGWRIGYVVADESFINAVIKLQQNMAVCVATPNQYAAIEAMSNSDKYTDDIKEVFRRRRDVLKWELDKIPTLKYHLPQGTFYVFIDITETGMKSKQFCFDLLEQEHVATIPGIAFGETFDDYVRLAFTLKEDKISEGMERIKHFINR